METGSALDQSGDQDGERTADVALSGMGGYMPISEGGRNMKPRER